MYMHFCVYRTALYFRRNSTLAHGRQTHITLEFTNYMDKVYVHIPTSRTPIALLSIDERLKFPNF